jgi:hypothetical protein
MVLNLDLVFLTRAAKSIVVLRFCLDIVDPYLVISYPMLAVSWLTKDFHFPSTESSSFDSVTVSLSVNLAESSSGEDGGRAPE